MTHQLYLRNQAEVESQRTSTRNQRIFILWQSNNTQIKSENWKIKVLATKENVPVSIIEKVLKQYVPVNQLEYE